MTNLCLIYLKKKSWMLFCFVVFIQRGTRSQV